VIALEKGAFELDGHAEFETGAVALEKEASSVRHACDDKME